MQSDGARHLISRKHESMKTILPYWLLLLPVVSFAQRSSLPQSSTVESVTIFLQGAQVTRTAQVSLRAGEHQYRLEKLSPYINAPSIRVQADGDYLIKSVFYQRN